MTQDEATQAVAQAASAAKSSADKTIRVIPFTGDPATDDDAIQAEIKAIHATYAPDTSPKHKPRNRHKAHRRDHHKNHRPHRQKREHAHYRHDASLNAAAAGCRDGSIGQEKRADFAWTQTKAHVTVKAYVYYRRVNCEQWKVREIESKLLANNYTRQIWLRDIEYTAMWNASRSRYIQDVFSLNCPQVFEGKWMSVKPGFLIKAGGSAQLESVDTNPNTPQPYWSCTWGAGTSAVSLWVYIPGGTR